MSAYYNEHDADKAAWLRELIKAGLIAPGEVDERDIQDVLPRELVGYTQCHFFAGIGIWSYALRCAGWPDDRRVWTGSCPCQPFSAAGKRGGTSDERHLWPAWFHLLRINKPTVVFGEQVASKDGLAWLDVVQSDLEAAAYVVGALDLCAAGFGAPHIRQRLFFVADALRAGRAERRSEPWFGPPTRSGELGELADTAGEGPLSGPLRRIHCQTQGERPRNGQSQRSRNASGLGHAESLGRIGRANNGNGGRGQYSLGQAGAANDLADANGSGRPRQGQAQSEERRGDSLASGRGPANGFWRDTEWIYCRDGLHRAAKPGSFPLAHGAAARILRLRGYGDGIVAPVAQAFIDAYMQEQRI